MEQFKQILDLSEKEIKGPYDWILITILTTILIYRIFVRLHKIKSFSEFDRLFFPKSEKSLQEISSNVIDYITFSLLYFIFGVVYSIFFSAWIHTLVHSFTWINFIIDWGFNISFALLMLKVGFKRTRLEDNLINRSWYSYIEKIFEYSFQINYYLSFVIYTLRTNSYLIEKLNTGTNNFISVLIALFILPLFLLFLYRSYNKKDNGKYVCTFITESEFNEARVVIHYTLDKDRIIFRNINGILNNEVYMYDRSAGKYYKFTKVNLS